MEQIFEALKGIIVRALPTFVLVIILHWFLKKVLFQPMERVMEERRKRTEGAVEASEAAIARVQEKLAGYEASLAEARGAIFRDQEKARKNLVEQQASLVEAARARQGEKVAAVRAALAEEVEKAKASLAAEAEQLSERVASVVLAGKVQ